LRAISSTVYLKMALCFSPDLCPTLDKIQGSGGDEEARWKEVEGK
jgi:hypothetical protein